jgi:hypothetical protein
LFFFARCGVKDGYLDFIHLVPPTVDPEVALPLLNSTVTVKELIKLVGADNPDILVTGRDGEMALQFLGTPVNNYADKFFKFEKLISFDVGNTPTETQRIVYKTLQANVLLVQSGVIKSGRIKYKLTSNEDAIILVSIPELLKNGKDGFKKEHKLEKGDTIEESIDLTGYTLKIKKTNRALEIGFTITNGIGAVIAMNGQFENLEYHCIEGYVNNDRTYILKQESNLLGLFEELKNGGFNFTSPSFSLSMANGFKMPFDISFDTLYAINTAGKVFDLNDNQITHLYQGQKKDQSSSVIDAKIKAYLKENPIFLNSKIAVTVKKNISKLYEVHAKDSLHLRTDVKLPLQFSTKGFEYFIEQNNELFNNDISAKEVELKLVTENEIPMNIGLQVFFIHGKKDTLYRLFPENKQFLNAATADKDGRTARL